MTESTQIDELYHEILALVARKVDQDVDVLEIAAVMATMSLSLYRTVLSDRDYDSIVDSIAAKRYEVKYLTPDVSELH